MTDEYKARAGHLAGLLFVKKRMVNLLSKAMTYALNQAIKDAEADQSAQKQASIVPAGGIYISATDVEHLKHARRELSRTEISPLHVRQRLAERITAMLAAGKPAQPESVEVLAALEPILSPLPATGAV